MKSRFRRISAIAVFLTAVAFTGYWTSPIATADDVNVQRKRNQRPGVRELAKATPSVDTPELKLSTGEVTSTSVTETSRKSIRKISRKIDVLVNAKLKEAGLKPAPLADDEVFLRRAYLDIVGRIPTLEETDAFLSAESKNKRSLLIDDLLDSYGYVSRQFNYWADLLRAKTDLRNIEGQPYIDFIKDSLTENQPYDEFVREMLTASGPNLQRGNGAVGYYMRDANMQEDNMSNTVRIFLGTRLECAQCHDHPFDVWTQRDYFEMVAFTGGIQYRRRDVIDSEHAKELRKLYANKELTQNERNAVRKIVEPMTNQITGSGNGLARLPEDYEMGDGDPHEIITAKTMFEKEPLVDAKIPPAPMRNRNKALKKLAKRFPQRIPNAKEIGSREAYADWMTSSDNPRFATVIANRMWKQAMGLGLVEPVDTYMDDTYASNQELMDYLGQVFAELDYDLKQFLRCIYNSNVYQRVADSTEVAEPDKHAFNGPLVRRLDAEQIWDSLLSLSVEDIDTRSYGNGKGLRYIPGVDMYKGYEKLRELDADDVKKLADAYAQRRNGNKGAMMTAMSDVFEMDGNDQREYIKAKNFPAQMARLNRQIRDAKKNKNRAAIVRLAKQRKELAEYARQLRKSGDLRRASELPSPAKPGHFLREFGQSDRETIENANQEPAVTQSLSMMNGLIENSIARYPQSVLMTNINAQDSLQAKVKATYRTMLSREPRLEEVELWQAALEDDERLGTRDLIWTLANSVEFLFIK